MLRLAVTGVIGFSDVPLRAAIWLGFDVTAFAALYTASVVVRWFAGDPHLVVGWASTIIVVSFLSGMNMVMTGLMGLYVGRIYNEVKRRPLYVVSERVGFDEKAAGDTAELPRQVGQYRRAVCRRNNFNLIVPAAATIPEPVRFNLQQDAMANCVCLCMLAAVLCGCAAITASLLARENSSPMICRDGRAAFRLTLRHGRTIPAMQNALGGSRPEVSHNVPTAPTAVARPSVAQSQAPS